MYATELLGNSQQWLLTKQSIDSIILSDQNTLIVGNAGTGTTTMAHYLYRQSNKQEQDCLHIDCQKLTCTNWASDPGTHLVKQLAFHKGHLVIGTFPPVDDILSQKVVPTSFSSRNIFVEAQPDTIILDKLDFLTLEQQSIVYRDLQDFAQLKDDWRIIGISHQEPTPAMLAKRYDTNLLSYLLTAIIRVPKLAERSEDFELLFNHFLNLHCNYLTEIGHKNASAKLHANAAAIGTLSAYEWPGNLTQLKSIVEFASKQALADQTSAYLTVDNSDRRIDITDYISQVKHPEAWMASNAYAEAVMPEMQQAIRDFSHWFMQTLDNCSLDTQILDTQTLDKPSLDMDAKGNQSNCNPYLGK